MCSNDKQRSTWCDDEPVLCVRTSEKLHFVLTEEIAGGGKCPCKRSLWIYELLICTCLAKYRRELYVMNVAPKQCHRLSTTYMILCVWYMSNFTGHNFNGWRLLLENLALFWIRPRSSWAQSTQVPTPTDPKLFSSLIHYTALSSWQCLRL